MRAVTSPINKNSHNKKCTKGAAIVRYAANAGYRVVGKNKIWSPVSKKFLTLLDSRGYSYIKLGNKSIGGRGSLYLHRLQAFILFGERLFRKGIQVRHLDGNPKNNSPENIEIGTQSQNILDQPQKDRITHALKAASKLRKITYKDAEKIRKEHSSGDSYKTIKKKWGLAKSTISYIVNYKTYNAEKYTVR